MSKEIKNLIYFTVFLVLFETCSALCELKWVKTDHKKLPANSVIANTGNGLGDFYPSRAVLNGVLTAGRFKPAEERCFVTMDGKEYAVQENFEVLTNPNHCILEWKSARQGTVPKGAVESGVDKQGGKAYVARIEGWGGHMVGKFYKSTGLMYYGWGGAEYHSSTYELLCNVEKATDKTLRPDCRNHKQFGNHDSFVCVCTESQPCDRLEGPTKTPKGIVTKWESNKLGARLRKNTIHMQGKGGVNIDKVNSQLYVKINRGVKHQTVLGFGGAFTDATGINFKKLGSKCEDAMIKDCFGKDGLEYNLARIPIAGSDFSTRAYSYDDNNGEDKTLQHFNLTHEDFEYKLPIIKKAQKMATHEIRFYASPWSAPKWMKTNNDLAHCGVVKGKIGEEYWKIYAKYFIKYLETYKKHGINHWGLTVQNEPLACQAFNSMYYNPEMERDFVKMVLGPELERNGYGPDKLKLMVLDHNVGLVKDWVDKVYADRDAAKYIAGTAIHWYGHDPKEMLDGPHNQHPDKFFLATEACIEGAPKLGDWNTADMYASDILDDLLHHVIGWTDWNMALDMQGGPNWVKNFVDAPLIVDNNEYYRQPSYYALAHFSKFLPPGSVRIDTPIVNKSNNNCLVGAFKTPNNSIVVIIVNTEDVEIDFISEDETAGKVVTKVAPRSIQTLVYYD